MNRQNKKWFWGLGYTLVFSILSIIAGVLLQFDLFFGNFLPKVDASVNGWALLSVFLMLLILLVFVFKPSNKKHQGLCLFFWFIAFVNSILLTLIPLTQQILYPSSLFFGEALLFGFVCTLILFVLLLPLFIRSLKRSKKQAIASMKEQPIEEIKKDPVPKKEEKASLSIDPILPTPTPIKRVLAPGLYLCSKESKKTYVLLERETIFGWKEYELENADEKLVKGNYQLLLVSKEGQVETIVPQVLPTNSGYTLEGKADKAFEVQKSLRVWNEMEKRSFNYINKDSVLSFTGKEILHRVFVRFYGDQALQNGYRWCVCYAD